MNLLQTETESPPQAKEPTSAHDAMFIKSGTPDQASVYANNLNHDQIGRNVKDLPNMHGIPIQITKTSLQGV